MNKDEHRPVPTPKKRKSELAAAASITIEQAIKAVTEKVSGKAVEVVLKEHLGKPVWVINLLTPEGQLREVPIDITTGMLIETKEYERSNTYNFKPDVLWSMLSAGLVALCAYRWH